MEHIQEVGYVEYLPSLNQNNVVLASFYFSIIKMNLFFASLDPGLDGAILLPKKPKEVKGIIEGKTPRTCFYPSISQALSALGPALKGIVIYVYKPNQTLPESMYRPTFQECPFRDKTGEVWYLGQARLTAVGQVLVTGEKSRETFRSYTPRLNEVPWITWSYTDLRSVQTKSTSKVFYVSDKWLGDTITLGPGTKVMEKPIVQVTSGKFIYKPTGKVKIHVHNLRLVGSGEFRCVS